MTTDAAASGVYDGIDERIGHPGDGAQLDRDDVVEHAAPVRVAGQVAADHPEGFGFELAGGIAMLSRSMSAMVEPV